MPGGKQTIPSSGPFGTLCSARDDLFREAEAPFINLPDGLSQLSAAACASSQDTTSNRIRSTERPSRHECIFC